MYGLKASLNPLVFRKLRLSLIAVLKTVEEKYVYFYLKYNFSDTDNQPEETEVSCTVNIFQLYFIP